MNRPVVGLLSGVAVALLFGTNFGFFWLVGWLFADTLKGDNNE